LKTATQTNGGTSEFICTQASVVQDDGHVTPLI